MIGDSGLRLQDIRQTPTGVLAYSTLFAICLLGVRWLGAGMPAYRFLVWDLVLAWSPLGLARLAMTLYRRQGAHPAALLFVALLWLLFFPNAPYLLTEFCHLHGQRNATWWYDLVLMLTVAGTGLMLGLLSLQQMHLLFAERHGERAGKWAAAAVLFLGSYGVALGRFNRFNSWDVARHPLRLAANVFAEVLRPWAFPRNGAMTVLLFVFLSIAYAMLWSIQSEIRTASGTAVPTLRR